MLLMLFATKCEDLRSQLPGGVNGRTDTSHRLLGGQTNVFFPVKDVGVQVEVCGPAPENLSSLEGCKACSTRLDESELISCLTAVSWRDIGSFNLKSIVSSSFFV